MSRMENMIKEPVPVGRKIHNKKVFPFNNLKTFFLNSFFLYRYRGKGVVTPRPLRPWRNSALIPPWPQTAIIIRLPVWREWRIPRLPFHRSSSNGSTGTTIFVKILNPMKKKVIMCRIHHDADEIPIIASVAESWPCWYATQSFQVRFLYPEKY